MVNKIRFGFQIFIIILIMLLMILFLEQMRDVWTFVAPADVIIISVSFWSTAISLSVGFYPDNEIINSYVFCVTIPFSSVAVYYTAVLGIYDLFHYIPIIVGTLILGFKRHTIKLKYVIIINILIMVWFFFMHGYGMFRSDVSAFYRLDSDFFYVLFMPTFIIAIILDYYNKKETEEMDELDG